MPCRAQDSGIRSGQQLFERSCPGISAVTGAVMSECAMPACVMPACVIPACAGAIACTAGNCASANSEISANRPNSGQDFCRTNFIPSRCTPWGYMSSTELDLEQIAATGKPRSAPGRRSRPTAGGDHLTGKCSTGPGRAFPAGAIRPFSAPPHHPHRSRNARRCRMSGPCRGPPGASWRRRY